MKIGYIRVNTEEQNTARQEVLLQELGVDEVFIDKASGKNADRPELTRMMNYVRRGDTVIVESISRFARNTRDLLDLVERLTEKQVEFVSRKEAIDTTTPTGKFMLTVFVAIAELEREYILQRQREGIAIAKAEGKYTGRKPIPLPDNFERVVARWRAGEITATEAMRQTGMKPNTFYRRCSKASPTLARKITDWICDSQNKPALLYSAGSTPAAIHDTMVTARDLPLVIDDLCLSASLKLQQKYRDLGAQFVREGTNASAISKKSGNLTTSFSCNAGIILTAEFALENPSDITRCIFIALTQPPVVTSSLTPKLIGAACRRFIEWFLQHESEAAEDFRKINSEEKPDDMHPRVFHNFLILRTVFSLALRAAREDGLSASSAEPITARYETGIEQSQQYQKKLLDDLDRSKKKGNLAFVLLECYGDPKVFNLTKNIKKLDKRDGIEWKNDLCLRPAALERAVRLQDGYQNYTLSKIARELKDMGALVIQEEGTLQVRLKKDTPRVYRIRFDALEEYEERF